MKVRRQNTKEGFTPFELVIQIETEEEEAALCNIVNHSYILEAANFNEAGSQIFNTLKNYKTFNLFDKELKRIFKKRLFNC